MGLLDMPNSDDSNQPDKDACSTERSLNLRSASPVTPFLFSVDSEADLTSDSQDPSVSGDDGRCWSTQNSAKMYCIDGWGHLYYSVNNTGHLCVHPQGGIHHLESHSQEGPFFHYKAKCSLVEYKQTSAEDVRSFSHR